MAAKRSRGDSRADGDMKAPSWLESLAAKKAEEDRRREEAGEGLRRLQETDELCHAVDLVAWYWSGDNPTDEGWAARIVKTVSRLQDVGIDLTRVPLDTSRPIEQAARTLLDLALRHEATPLAQLIHTLAESIDRDSAAFLKGALWDRVKTLVIDTRHPERLRTMSDYTRPSVEEWQAAHDDWLRGGDPAAWDRVNRAQAEYERQELERERQRAKWHAEEAARLQESTFPMKLPWAPGVIQGLQDLKRDIGSLVERLSREDVPEARGLSFDLFLQAKTLRGRALNANETIEIAETPDSNQGTDVRLWLGSLDQWADGAIEGVLAADPLSAPAQTSAPAAVRKAGGEAKQGASGQDATGSGAAETKAKLPLHSADFTSIVWTNGTTYTFTKAQGAAVKVLWAEFDKGDLTLSEETIGEKVSSAADDFRMSKLFRDTDAWNDGLFESPRKGTFRLRRLDPRKAHEKPT